MSIRFLYLWIMWLAGVAYDLFVSFMHFFPERSLAERLITDASIAWFLIGAWLAALCIDRTSTISSRKQGCE